MVSCSSEIIKSLAKKMNKSVKAVHLMVNRKIVIPSTKKKENKEHKYTIVPSQTENRESAEEMLCDNIVGIDNRDLDVPTKPVESFCESFQLEDEAIFETHWCKMKHRNKMINKQRVKPGWSNKLGLFLFEKTKFCCKFDFDNIWVTNEGKITAVGNCECKARANISFHLNVLKVDINYICHDFPHTRVYQMRGQRKAEFIEQLEHKSAKAIQTKLINDLNPNNTELDTKHNPFATKLNALRILKHRDHKRDTDPIDVLLDWKNEKYQNVLSAISHAPFYMFYRSALQLAWYVVESRKRSISISIDATGSLVTPPPRSQKIEGSNKLKHVFLYTIMAKTGSRSVPIAQMLSQDQSSDFIIFFLKKMFKDLKIPVEVVCDESKALLKALSTTFAKIEKIEGYIAACMSSLLHGTTAPDCYIRIDRSHFVKNITRKIKCRDFRKRNLFRGVIGYLIKCDSFITAKKIINDFFTLILNEKDGFDGKNPLPAETARIKLLALCSTHDENVNYAEDSDVLDLEVEDTETNLDYNADSNWLNEIIEKVIVTKSENQYHDNLYYSRADMKMYVKIFSSIVLWSNVMNPLFGSSTLVATSSDVESYFKTLKTAIFGRNMYRADEFFEIHNDFVNAEIKLNAMSNDNHGTSSPKKRKRSNSLNERPSMSPGK